jgi:hypothetical protein
VTRDSRRHVSVSSLPCSGFALRSWHPARSIIQRLMRNVRAAVTGVVRSVVVCHISRYKAGDGNLQCRRKPSIYLLDLWLNSTLPQSVQKDSSFRTHNPSRFGLNGSHDSVRHSESLGLRTLSIVQRLRLALSKAPNWLDASLPSPVDGNWSSFRNVFFVYF